MSSATKFPVQPTARMSSTMHFLLLWYMMHLAMHWSTLSQLQWGCFGNGRPGFLKSNSFGLWSVMIITLHWERVSWIVSWILCPLIVFQFPYVRWSRAHWHGRIAVSVSNRPAMSCFFIALVNNLYCPHVLRKIMMSEVFGRMQEHHDAWAALQDLSHTSVRLPWLVTSGFNSYDFSSIYNGRQVVVHFRPPGCLFLLCAPREGPTDTQIWKDKYWSLPSGLHENPIYFLI